MNVADLVATLKLNTSDFTSGMRSVTSSLRKWAADMESTVSKTNRSTKDMGSGFKDVSRIVQGIFVSKAIYGTLNAIKDVTVAVADFSSNMEYAEMAYSNLFRDPALAKEFINVLQDYAAISPFNVGDLRDSTMMLKAYGIEAENLMYVTKGVMTAAAGQKNTKVIPQITRAIGQIYTKGTMKAEEARQLAEAGIPVYEILGEKLGLTAKELGNLGDQAIPANKAINALVDGINERFGNLLEDSSKTMAGLASNIQDNFLIIGQNVTMPIQKAFKSLLQIVGDSMDRFRDAVTTQGIGGLFEAMIPKQLQAELRILIANIMILGRTIGTILGGALKVVGALLPSFIQALNLLLGVVNVLGVILSSFIGVVTNNATALKILTAVLVAGAAAWAIWKAQALGAIVAAGLAKMFAGIASGVALLIRTLSLLVAHPVWALLAAAGGIFVGLAASTNKWKGAMNGILGSFTKISGIDTNKLLLPSQKERAADMEKFNKRLGDTSGSMDDLAKKTGKAAKAAQGLLGFDEVFKLPELDDGSGGGAMDKLADLLGGMGMDGMLDKAFPSAGALGAWGKNFVQKMTDALKPYMDSIFATGLGALLGAVLGGLIGGKVGAVIGAALGALAGYLWNELADRLGLSGAEKLGIGLGAGIGAAIGWIMGGPGGAIVGAAIGALVGWIASLLYEGFVNHNWKWDHLSIAIGTGIGAAIGFVMGGPLGAAIGAAIGALVGYVGSLLIKGFETGSWEYSKITTILGGLIGAAIGAVVAGPVGAAIGAAIGTLIGWITGRLIDGFQANKWDTSQITTGVGTSLVAALGVVIGGPIGGLLSTTIATICGWISEKISSGMGGTTTFFADMWNKVVGIFEGAAGKSTESMGPLAKGIDDFFSNLALKLDTSVIDVTSWFDVLGLLTGQRTEGLSTQWSSLFTKVLTSLGIFSGDTVKNTTVMWDQIVRGHEIGSDLMRSKFNKYWEDVKEIHRVAAELIVTRLTNSWEDQRLAIEKKTEAIRTNLKTAWEAIWIHLEPLFKRIADAVHLRWGDMSNDIDQETGKSKGLLETSWDAIARNLIGKASETNQGVGRNFQDMYVAIKHNTSEAASAASKAFLDMNLDVLKKINNMVSESKVALDKMLKDFVDWTQSLWNNVFSKLFGWLDDGMEKIKDFLKAQVDAEKAEKKAKEKEEKTSSNSPGGSSGGYVNSGPGIKAKGHALGGVFNQEHWAPFAEGNKAEAIIPLENNTAMKPFTDAVADNLLSTLAPLLAGSRTENPDNLRPLYVGTLIADDRGLRDLQRRLRLISTQENTRGLTDGRI